MSWGALSVIVLRLNSLSNSYPRKSDNPYMAGLLTCNILTSLPIKVDSGLFAGQKLLTVAGQLMNFTSFPINL